MDGASETGGDAGLDDAAKAGTPSGADGVVTSDGSGGLNPGSGALFNKPGESETNSTVGSGFASGVVESAATRGTNNPADANIGASCQERMCFL